MTRTDLAAVLRGLPKAELHLHLEGTIRPHIAVELAARYGVSLTEDEAKRRYEYADFIGFIEAFKRVTSFVRQPADYALITRRMAEELAAQNVVYAE
ncbi:MAG: adenosine deaminase, partial [Candidatus Acidiferrales bacterium]